MVQGYTRVLLASKLMVRVVGERGARKVMCSAQLDISGEMELLEHAG